MNEVRSPRAHADRGARRNYVVLCIVATMSLVGMVATTVVLMGE
jgi:hypothetical protein